jgi:hypothetical protein
VQFDTQHERAWLRLAGSVEFAGLASPPRYERADVLLEKGRQLFPRIGVLTAPIRAQLRSETGRQRHESA